MPRSSCAWTDAHARHDAIGGVLAGLAAGDTVLVGRAQGITIGAPVKVSAPSDKPVAKN